MATLTNADKTILEEAFFNALKNWGGTVPGGGGGGRGGGGAGGPGGPGGGGALKSILEETGKTFKKAGSSAVELGAALANGGADVGKAADILAKNFAATGVGSSAFSKALGGATAVTSALVNYIQNGLPAFQKLNDSGASFNNSVIGMRGAAAGMGLTIDEMSGFFQQNGKKIAQLGAGAADAAKNFAVLSKGLIQSPIGDRLAHLGYTTTELNELLAITTMNMSQRELKEAGGTDRAIKSAADLAEEMDAMAKLTGKSRKDQMKALEEQKADGRSQAAVQLEILKGNKNAGQAFDAAMAQAGVAGKSFQSVMRDMVTSGRPQTEENRRYYAMMSAETKKAIDDARAAYEKGDVEAAKRASERAAALEAADMATNRSRLELAKQGQQTQKQASEEQLRYGKILTEQAQKMGLSMEDPRAIEAAKKELNKQIEDEKNKRDGSTASVIEMNNRLRNAASALQDGLIGPLNEEVKPKLQEFANWLGGLNKDFKISPIGAKDQGKVEKGFVADIANPLKTGVDALFRGTKMEAPPPVEIKDPEIAKAREASLAVTKELANLILQNKGTKQDVNKAVELKMALESKNSEAVAKALKDLADKQNKPVDQMLKDAASTKGGLKQLTDQLAKDRNLEFTLKAAEENRKRQEAADKRAESNKQAGQTVTGTSVERAAAPIGELLSGAKNITTGAIDYITVNGDIKTIGKEKSTEAPTSTTPGEPIPERKTGSLGMTGKLVEDFGEGTLAMLHGREGVITEDQLNSLVKGIQGQSLESAVNLLKQSVGTDGNIDLSKLSNDINVSINVTKPTTTTSETKNVGNVKVEEIVKAFKNVDTLNTKVLNAEKLPEIKIENKTPVTKIDNSYDRAETAKFNRQQTTPQQPNKENKSEKENVQKQITEALQKELSQGNANANTAFNSIVSNTSGQLKNAIAEIVATGKPLTEENKKYYTMLSAEAKEAINEARTAYQKGDAEAATNAAKRAQELSRKENAIFELSKQGYSKLADDAAKRTQLFAQSDKTILELASQGYSKLAETNAKKDQLISQTDKSILALIASGAELTEENKKYYASLNAETRAAIDEANAAYRKSDLKLAEDATKRAQTLAQTNIEFLKKLIPKDQQPDTKNEKVEQSIIVKYGDTLSGLAKKYGTSIEDIVKANPLIKDPNKIFEGAKLVIPGLEKKNTTQQTQQVQQTQQTKINPETGDRYFTEVQKAVGSINDSIGTGIKKLDDSVKEIDINAQVVQGIKKLDDSVKGLEIKSEDKSVAQGIKKLDDSVKGLEIKSKDGQNIKINPETGDRYFTEVQKAVDSINRIPKDRTEDIAQPNTNTELGDRYFTEVQKTIGSINDIIGTGIKKLDDSVVKGLDSNKESEIQNSKILSTVDNITGAFKGLDIKAEDGSVAQGIKTNPETGDRYFTDLQLGSIKSSVKENISDTIKTAQSQMVYELKPKTSSEDEENKTPIKTETISMPMAKEKTANLDDVVRELNQLNKGIHQLLNQHEDLTRKQIRATKTVGINNVYENYMP